jgi:hypothetical protein
MVTLTSPVKVMNQHLLAPASITNLRSKRAKTRGYQYNLEVQTSSEILDGFTSRMVAAKPGLREEISLGEEPADILEVQIT